MPKNEIAPDLKICFSFPPRVCNVFVLLTKRTTDWPSKEEYYAVRRAARTVWNRPKGFKGRGAAKITVWHPKIPKPIRVRRVRTAADFWRKMLRRATAHPSLTSKEQERLSARSHRLEEWMGTSVVERLAEIEV